MVSSGGKKKTWSGIGGPDIRKGESSPDAEKPGKGTGKKAEWG